MTRSVLLVGFALLLVAAKQTPQIPLEYQGSWSMDPAYCNFEGDTLDNELYITADSVGFHAEQHRVKSARLNSRKLLLRYFKMKDAYRVAPKTLVLSSDKNMLNDTWHKCPEMPQDEKAE